VNKTPVAVLVAALAVLVGAGPSLAKPVPATLTVGAGKTACRDWLAARKKPEPAPAVLEQWVLGYLSGYNAFAPPPRDAFTDYDSRNVLGWVDTRCAQNPSSSLSQALNDFITSLARPH
jgi:hypothetical protein